MRIEKGKYATFQFPIYKSDNTRPTTNMAKEALFSTLEGYLNWEKCVVVDLFAGTGNIGLEALSRGATELYSVDIFNKNILYLHEIKKKLQATNWHIIKKDALQYLQQQNPHANLIFADPPYNYAGIHALVNFVLQTENFKNNNCIFVLEHIDRVQLESKEIFLRKKYGNTCFTFYKFAD